MRVSVQTRWRESEGGKQWGRSGGLRIWIECFWVTGNWPFSMCASHKIETWPNKNMLIHLRFNCTQVVHHLMRCSWSTGVESAVSVTVGRFLHPVDVINRWQTVNERCWELCNSFASALWNTTWPPGNSLRASLTSKLSSFVGGSSTRASRNSPH